MIHSDLLQRFLCEWLYTLNKSVQTGVNPHYFHSPASFNTRRPNSSKCHRYTCESFYVRNSNVVGHYNVSPISMTATSIQTIRKINNLLLTIHICKFVLLIRSKKLKSVFCWVIWLSNTICLCFTMLMLRWKFLLHNILCKMSHY